MYESNVRQRFTLSNGTVVTEKPFGFQFLRDDALIAYDSVTVGFECGAPPAPAVSCCSSRMLPRIVMRM